jgi:type II secretory pathway pseudopilin PulG
VAKTKNNAFTIVELLVAMSLLVILLGLSGMVFKTTVSAHRAAGATIDVSRNLRAITEQISTDLRGLRKDAPLALWFERDPATGRRYDQIQFFADGDFQTTRQYFDGSADTTVYGNLARVYYGHGWLVDISAASGNPQKGYREFSISNGDTIGLKAGNALARRTHLLTQDPSLPQYLNGADPPFPEVDPLIFEPALNNYYEYDQLVSLNKWKQLLTDPANCDLYLDTCFNNVLPPGDETLAGRPVVDMGEIDFLHNLLSQGVMQMQIQFSYIDPATQQIRWYPSRDPDGDGNIADSDFTAVGLDQFGYYYNMPVGVDPDMDGDGTPDGSWYPLATIPKALKFTFVLRDSNGVFADGKTFTHIVYLDN